MDALSVLLLVLAGAVVLTALFLGVLLRVLGGFLFCLLLAFLFIF